MVQVVVRMVARGLHRRNRASAADPDVAAASTGGLCLIRAVPGVSAPQTICYIEEWQKSQALDRQIRSNHYTRLLALIEEAAEA
ncbi:MAG: hypothetical protein AB1716_10825 [Planctomycetota bacterium]